MPRQPWDRAACREEAPLTIGYYTYDGVCEASPACVRAVKVQTPPRRPSPPHHQPGSPERRREPWLLLPTPLDGFRWRSVTSGRRDTP